MGIPSLPLYNKLLFIYTVDKLVYASSGLTTSLKINASVSAISIFFVGMIANAETILLLEKLLKSDEFTG